MNPALIQWGPTLLILFGIVLGVIYNNRSISHLDTRINDLIRNEDIRHTDLKDLIKSEIRRVEERIARLEQPIIRS
jgi:low affinity Fe/Cu permease